MERDKESRELGAAREWERFAVTGKVEDYLRYRNCTDGVVSDGSRDDRNESTRITAKYP